MILMLVILLFTGLRTTYNDTMTYTEGYALVNADNFGIKDVFRNNGGFNLFQVIIKTLMGSDPQNLIFVSGVVTTLLYVPFLIKYSDDFKTSLFWFLIGQGMFCMAGIKQAISMGIALYSLEKYIQRRYSHSIILLWLAFSFHPHVLCLVVAPLLMKRSWSQTTVLVSMGIVALFGNLDFLFDTFGDLARDLSADYSINPLRVVVCSIPVVISFLYKKQINNSRDLILILGVNMNIISFLFIILGFFFSPIYMGRMSLYFDLISFLYIPKLIKTTIGKQGTFYSMSYYLLFFMFFMCDMNKGGFGSFFNDRFHHINLFTYLSSLGD
ncbi:MAG: EpsG family protein [Thermoguttaceae bacterium]|nr:EpsG family protein [Thermoguttaceae bacterium]